MAQIITNIIADFYPMTYHLFEQKRLQLRDCSISQIWHKDNILCWALELPWNNNTRRRSCIPAERYELLDHVSPKFGRCLLVSDVPGRDGILFHGANYTSQLLGCIAPATQISVQEINQLTYSRTGVSSGLTRTVRGVASRAANDALHEVAFALLRTKPLFLDIEVVDSFPKI